MVVVKEHDHLRVCVMNGQRPDLNVVIGPETLRSLVVDLISRCWHQTPDDRPTFAGICLSVEIFHYMLKGNYHENMTFWEKVTYVYI